MMFRDQVGVLASWFKGWNECEQTVALLSLLKRVSRTQARFLQLCLEHSLSECTELHVLEVEANNPAVIGQWRAEPRERLISLVLTHLPLLKPGNSEAKSEYMRLLPKILTHTIEYGRHLEESRQLLSYALIHPATSLEDRADLALWLNHLEERAATRTAGGGGGGGGDSLERVPSSHHLYAHHQRYGSDDRLNGWQGSRDSGIATWHTQQQQQGCENGHLLLYPSSSVPSTINTVGTGSGSNSNVPAWLKSLRLHKYAGLFSTMTYEEMMSLTEHQLEAQSVTKGARHKIIISIQKLKERQNMLRSLEKDVLEGGNLRSPLQELHYIIGTPIKAFNSVSESPQRPLLSSEGKSAATGVCVSGGEAESSTTLIAEGDIPAQFTRVMGKVCTQLLVSRPDEENISSYLQLINKCELHEAFTETQKKRLSSWRQQVQKLVRSFPRKPLLDMTGYRQQRSRGFGQSNSLPSAVCVSSSVCSRRNLRQFPVPSRSLPAPRLGLLGTTGLLTHTHTPRSSNNTPTNLKQGRQGLWFANPGGSNSMPSRTHSSVQRTRSLPVHTNPHTMAMFQQADLQVPVTEPDINNRLESLCRSMTEHALEDGVDRTSTI
ncbi:protein Smaug homolog 1 isoform 4-T4 [Clarias gariepinus]|uniref:protein Smaug homolog 1 isoform X4 n=1 Tax=Clarias gariepinus TaxID=13013 RepID=UPI00234D2CB5|nr:protein Smaug homolog 1 isoform X4 [Clarias gariepinus]